MNRVFSQCFYHASALAANTTITWTVPFDVQLIHASLVTSNDSDLTLKIGNSGDDDAYVLSGVVGDSGTPVEKALADFVGDQYPHIADGTVMLITIDYDGASGTAGENLCIVLTFSEG